MERKQLAALFICNVIPNMTGNALIPLLPLYLKRFNVSESGAGLFLAAIFAAIACGTYACGWVSAHYGRHKTMLITAAIIDIPILYLMGQMQSFDLFLLCASIVWFSGGFILTSLNILVGLNAEPERRGSVFGLLGLAVGTAQILGGLVSGQIIKHWDYDVLFSVLALLHMLVIFASLTVKDKGTTPRKRQTQRLLSAPIPAAFWLIFVASILVYVVNFAGGLGRPLAMEKLGFDETAIANTTVASGIIALLLPLTVGRLSDRMGRHILINACYVAVFSGVVMLVFATAEWHFWISTMLIAPISAAFTVGNALVTDILPQDSYSVGISRYSSTPWIAAVIGFVTAGVVINVLGVQVTFLIGALLPLISIMLMNTQRRITPEKTSTPYQLAIPEGAD